MLARHGFGWLIAAVLAGLLPALVLAGQVAHTALEQAALARLAQDVATLAADLQSPRPPALPPGGLLLSAGGIRLAGEANVEESLLRRAATGMAGQGAAAAPWTMARASGLLAVQPLKAPDGTMLGAVGLWQPAARVEARLTAILLLGLRDVALLVLLCVPAAWIGARLLLSPLAAAAVGGAALLDALRVADIAAEQAETELAADPVLASASAGADPQVVAAAGAAAALLGRLDATATAMMRAEAEGAPA